MGRPIGLPFSDGSHKFLFQPTYMHLLAYRNHPKAYHKEKKMVCT